MASFSAIDAPTTSRARELLRRSGPAVGTNQAFFEKVVKLSGSDATAARKLAARWKVFYELGDYPAMALRARAVGERIAGKWSQAGESFLEAAKAGRVSRDRAVFGIGAVDSFARAGDVAKAIKIGKRIARQLENLGDKAQASRVHLNMGNALLFVDDYEGASKQFSTALESLESPREIAAAELGLSGSLLFSGEVSESRKHAENAIKRFESLDDLLFADLARINLAHCFNLQGRSDESLQLLSEIGPRIADSPSDNARRQEFLGDAYLRLNLFEEAIGAYAAALDSTALRHIPINLANSYFGMGSALAAMGDEKAAKKRLRRAAKIYSEIGNNAWAGAALSAAAELETPGRAEANAKQAITLLRKSKSAFHLAIALIKFGERFCNKRAMQEAEAIISRHKYEFLGWRIDAFRAQAAKQTAKLEHWRSMFSSILTDRQHAITSASRAAFLRDKHQAIGGYLAHLLSESPPMVDEALDVVTKSRSVTLIDELIAANPAALSQETRHELEQFREEVARETASDLHGTRRIAGSGSRITELSRRLVEAEAIALKGRHPHQAKVNPRVAVFADTADGFFWMMAGESHRLNLDYDAVSTMVRRAEFELLSPMVGLTEPQAAVRELAEIRSALFAGMKNMPAFVVPDGALWGLPWSAVTGAEVVALANPVFAAEFARTSPKKVVVWAHDPGDLPNVGAEAESLLELFPSALVVSRREDALQSLENGVDLLHVAAHASVRSDNPLYSHIELADGPLFGLEIARARGLARQVTLSACDTGRVSLRQRMEPDGLVRSFLTVGAESVLASLWPLDDEGARRLMHAYYKGVARGETLVNALASARAAVRDWREHPYYWASMTIFGGYGRKVS